MRRKCGRCPAFKGHFRSPRAKTHRPVRDLRMGVVSSTALRPAVSTVLYALTLSLCASLSLSFALSLQVRAFNKKLLLREIDRMPEIPEGCYIVDRVVSERNEGEEREVLVKWMALGYSQVCFWLGPGSGFGSERSGINALAWFGRGVGTHTTSLTSRSLLSPLSLHSLRTLQATWEPLHASAYDLANDEAATELLQAIQVCL